MGLPIDRGRALEFLGGDEAVYQDLVSLLADQAQQDLAALEAAVAAGDGRAVERVAHGLKGAAANLAADAVQEAAAELEQVGWSRDLAAAPAGLAALRDRVGELVAFARQSSAAAGDARPEEHEMTLRWGIIGCGNVAEHKGGPALYGVAGSELVAVMRRDVAKAADFARRHGARRWYDQASDLLADAEINAVYVATPVSTHRGYTLAAAEAGKHVLCEKPMAMDVAECREMIAACRANGVMLTIAYYRRSYPVVQRMKAALAEGLIGRPMLARINLTSYSQPTDVRAPGAWRTDPDTAGGGVLFDVGSHRLDVLNYLLGPAAEVAAMCENTLGHYQVEDAAVLCLKLASGVHGVANFGWNVGSDSDEFEIYGAEGKMLARSLEGGHLEIYRGRELVETFDQPRHKVTHWGLVENMVAAASTGAPLLCSGEDGLVTSQLMEAAYLSARERRTIGVASG